MKKLLALLLVLGLIAASCGGSDESETSTDESTDDTTAEAADESTDESTDEGEEAADEASGDKTVVRWIFGGSASDSAQELESTFEAANPDIDIEIIQGPESATDLLGTYLQTFEAQSDEIDVLNIDVIWPGDLAEHLLDMYEYGAADVVDAHFPAIVENNTRDGRLVGIPFYTDAGLLYYRTDLLDKYGYDGPPATWDELEEMAQTIQDGEQADGNQDFTGFVWQGNAYEGLTCDALEWIKSYGGGEIVSPEGEITINNENAVAALEQAAGWVGTISPEGVTAFQEEEARAIWHAGNAAFMRNWPYAYSRSQSVEDDSQVVDLFGIGPLPAGPEGSPAATLGGWQIAVSKYSANPEEAARFALFLTSEEGQKINALNDSLLPTIEALYSDDEVLANTPFFADLFDVFTNAVARPSTITAPNYNQTSVAFFNAVHGVLTGETDAQTAVEELELDIADITGLELAS
ncbi:MAG: ABC transporter substrate-binding protein [Acidimicrobiia bacterium]|nr:ABC transporter substrate-binding protein [Acidimicrobiia bacterium]